MLPCVRVRGAIAAALLGVSALSGCASTTAEAPSEGLARPSPAGVEQPGPDDASRYEALAPADPTSTLPTTPVTELPAQAVDTLRLIQQGGPFPYAADGATFQNRERILPPAPRGFYQEYTVITPGADDRGARRIVAADDGGRFYTDDHYDSFTEVVSG